MSDKPSETGKLNSAPRGLRRKVFVSLLLLLCALALAACRDGGYNRPAEPAQNQTRDLADDLGRKIKIPERVERVVSLAPSLTENIFAVGAGDRLVGVTEFCNYPEEAARIQKVGDTLNPNIETIIALKPQIVFVSTASQLEAFMKTLEAQGITVFVTNPKDLNGVLANLQQLGEIFGTRERTGVLLNELMGRILAVDEQTRDRAKAKTFVQISKEPLFTIGKESFLTEIIDRAGGVSVTKDVPTAYPKISKETALAFDPDVIILSESPDNLEPNDVFKKSPAVKNKRVFKINADLLSRPSPRVVDGLEQIAEALKQ
ncbi:MAG TPA: cobalamin-binding protein [Pyrinomonadaceae bacterium]|jgi:iron complex transport system substrate-binding protein